MNRTKKLLALLLCVVMCLSLFPVSAFAADEGPAGDAAEEAAMAEAPVDTAEEEEPGEPEEPEDPAAPADDAVDRDTEEGSDGTPAAPADGDGENGEPETPDDAAEPAEGGDGEADPAEEPAEGEENEDAEEAEDADEEEEEQKELPCGFAGMPEDYEFSGEELAAKRALTEKGVLASLKGGVRYEEGKLLLSTDSREYAELAAAAYNAELKSFNGHFAVLILTDATVAEAVETAADMELPLPAVEPNWIVTVDPIIRSSGSGDAVSVQGLLDAQNWETWYSNTENPDEYLRLGIDEFAESFRQFLYRKQKIDETRRHYSMVERERETMENRMRHICRVFAAAGGSEELRRHGIDFREFIPNQKDRYDIVVSFVSLLQLMREKFLDATQEKLYGNIMVTAGSRDIAEAEEGIRNDE